VRDRQQARAQAVQAEGGGAADAPGRARDEGCGEETHGC
jgi:hypothetical protein